MLISYLLLRLITFPFAFLPMQVIHFVGKQLGTLAYYLLTSFRKRALSNLALAKDLHLSNDEVRQIAKASFQNLMITCLEYPKLSREKEIHNIVMCENPEEADAIMAKGKGVIFFCGHQANWELLFLEGTSRMKGVAIGRPIKNLYLYNWVMKIRQQFGGKIISPKNAAKEGLRGLKEGCFLGIVGDQGMPNSGYSSLFLGRKAWTSPLPAMLAYKTNTPLIVATTRREKGHYRIRYSPVIYPQMEAPFESEVKRLMDKALKLFEESIHERPHEWLWIHNRWKQQSLDRIKRPFRQDSIACFLPENETTLKNISILREIYPEEHLVLFIPKTWQNKISIEAEIHPYSDINETLLDDLRFKLIYNFTPYRKIDRHYKKRSAQVVVHPRKVEDILQWIKNA